MSEPSPGFAAARSVARLAHLHVAAVLVQLVLAYAILSGAAFDAIEAHEWNANLVVALCALMTVRTIVAWKKGGSDAMALLALLILACEIGQLFVGYHGHIGIHIPLGIIIALLSCVMSLAALIGVRTLRTALPQSDAS